MNTQIIKQFKELKVIGQRSAITPQEKIEKDAQLIRYLKSAIDNNVVTDFEDVGFCYWNISDNYALMKDGHSLMRNHQIFYEHIKNNDPCYLYWTVCDATQRLTLEKDGFSEFWWGLYEEATEKNYNNNVYFAEFNAHRAALYISPFLPHTEGNLKFAKANFEDFLNKTIGMPEHSFYRIIYLSLISRFSSFDKSEMKRLCESLFGGLLQPKITSDFLTGEWKGFITPFDVRTQSVVGINATVNVFIYGGDLKTAKDIYTHACELGFPRNHYIEKRL